MSRHQLGHDPNRIVNERDARSRADGVGEALRGRLRHLLDFGFDLRVTDGGVSVSLGSPAVLTVYCEADVENGDAVTNWVVMREHAEDRVAWSFDVQDKSQIFQIALRQLERALMELATRADEFASGDVPMGWVDTEGCVKC